jgi:transposase
MDDYPQQSPLHRRYELLKPILDERLRRLWAAAEALTLGAGGVAILSNVTSLSRTTIQTGISELRTAPENLRRLSLEGRVRRPGAGRKSILEKQGEVASVLEQLIKASDPEGGSLLWTCKSTRVLSEDLGQIGVQVSYRTVASILHRLGYTLTGREAYRSLSLGNRVEQFRRISRTASACLRHNEPVFSAVVAKSRPARKGGTEEEVSARSSYLIPPDCKTASLIASMVLCWLRRNGNTRFPGARRILLVTDAAGQPASDRELWVPPLRTLARDLGCDILVSHFPPGIRRWKESQRKVQCMCSIYEEREMTEDILLKLDLVLPGAVEGSRNWMARSASARTELSEDLWNYTVRSAA